MRLSSAWIFPDPYAARLWIEYIFSDEGQLFFLKGYAHPVRYQVLQAAGKIPADLAAKLPSADQYANVKFLTIDNLRTGWLHDLMMGFSSVAANFAGVPLAFAFIATLGVEGYITLIFLHWFHIDLYNNLKFSLYSFWGLVMIHCYFLLPLMVLVTLPALEALRPEWREAATNLGASSFTYWRKVDLPVLLPSLISDLVNIYNTPQLLVCAYVIIALPFVFRPIDNNLRAINTRVLSEASFSLGCGWWRTFLTVILPNIWPGVISASLLTFSTAMGEFTLASLFGLETFPVYLNVTQASDPHKAAALTIFSFLLTLLCMLGILLVPRLSHGRAGGTERLDIIAAK
jgi:ABC-type uncharacterized transport system permease subunit